MQTYIRTADSTQFAAIRATRGEIKAAGIDVDFVRASKDLRAAAHNGSIPTYRICADGKLGRL